MQIESIESFCQSFENKTKKKSTATGDNFKVNKSTPKQEHPLFSIIKLEQCKRENLHHQFDSGKNQKSNRFDIEYMRVCMWYASKF